MAELRVLRSWLMSSARRQPSARAVAGACSAPGWDRRADKSLGTCRCQMLVKGSVSEIEDQRGTDSSTAS